jgi:hypothetical protein
VVFPFPYPGLHWQKNLRLIYQLIKILKIPEKIFLKSIQNYQGIKRRFEIVKHITRTYADYTWTNADKNSLPGFKPDKLPGYKPDISGKNQGNKSGKYPGKSKKTKSMRPACVSLCL